MTDERFIEMLNLYIDRELTAAEIPDIEEAIASSPERQAIYAKYCRMEHATRRLLTETEIPRPNIRRLVEAARRPDNEIEFPAAAITAAPRRRSWLAWGAPLTVAAAACVALVFTVSGPSTTPNASAPPVAAKTAPIASPTVEQIPYQTVFVMDAAANDDRLPGMRADDDSFAWMTQLQFAPIDRTELDSWEMNPATPIQVRSLNPRWVSPVGLDDSPPREAVTAFQFQR